MSDSQKLPSQITVRQVRSSAGRDFMVKRQLAALGMGRIGTERTFKSPNAALMGQIKKLRYLFDIKQS